MTFCPGYLRGLAFVDDFAVVGLSKCRQNKTFSGLALDERLVGRIAAGRFNQRGLGIGRERIVQGIGHARCNRGEPCGAIAMGGRVQRVG